MIDNPKYSVIVPVFNSENTLTELIARIAHTMQPFGAYEIICIDDFSTDNSWRKLIEIKKTNQHLRLIKLTKNFGQAATTICGIRKSKADTMIIIDDDLQYPPEEIKKLIHHFNPEEKYVLFGVPKVQKHAFFKRIASRAVTAFLNKIVLRNKNKIGFSTFRILTKKRFARETYNEQTMKSAQVFFTMVSPELMDSIPVNHQKRKKGKSNYSFFKRIQIALELLLVTTQLPLYFFVSAIFVSLPVLFFLCYLLFFASNTTICSMLILIGITLSFLLISCGFVFLFTYLRKIFLSVLGADVYAIWEER